MVPRTTLNATLYVCYLSCLDHFLLLLRNKNTKYIIIYSKSVHNAILSVVVNFELYIALFLITSDRVRWNIQVFLMSCL